MRRVIPRFFKLAVSVGITGLFAIGYPAGLRAQTIFCPATFQGLTTNFTLANGSCTNPDPSDRNGAFSGAALSSQALSGLSQTTTQGTTREIEKAIFERREQEREPRRRPVSEPAPAAEGSAVRSPFMSIVPREKPTPAAVVRKEPPPPPALLPIEPAVRFGTWTQVFGDYQKRDAAGPAILNCCDNGVIPSPFVNSGVITAPPTLALNIESRTSTVGFVTGADLTSRALFSASDGFIAGVTAGYTSSELTLNTTATSIDQPVGPGVSHLRATLSGPTAGLYGTYFNAGFSSDVTVKFDFLTLNETFNDLLATTIQGAAFIPFAGAGSVSLLNSTVVGNFNYRFDLYPNVWIEPTVGVQYTNSSYGSGAAQLGLADGHLVRLQGGARFGISTLISNGVLMTTTLTGLAYNDVVVQGGIIPLNAFEGNNLLVQADQGFMRGQGGLALKFDFGNGMSSFVQGDVYGGAHLFGASGKAGVRYQW
jgi:hypothetical protein